MDNQQILKFASIDIGSNAMRLLLCNVYEGEGEPLFKKSELMRFPLRLGEDAFLLGYISEGTIRRLVKIMKGFRLLIEAYDALGYRVCATAAMREATNRKEVLDRVKAEAGVTIEIIEGRLEAEIIYSNHIAEHLENDNNYLYIDVGGGSTELTLFSKGKMVSSGSYNIGTIRMLHDKVTKDMWRDFKEQVRKLAEGNKPIVAIGSGGNINKIFKIANRKENQFLSFDKLRECYDFVSSFTYDQRIRDLQLNPDRADVIIPAFRIFIAILKAAEIERIMVPQVGLSDGIIHLLYEDFKSKQLMVSTSQGRN
ncbi:MAG: ethanolamine ammonia-lyase reactivating factor EutA [Bacteroidota bacterium]|nr:ethanolamine ammonia-lyase reactivating factor EutA [Bacteroidota bacterium]